MNKYIQGIFLSLTFSSCFNSTRISTIIPDNEYEGWFIGTSGGNFFVIQKRKSLKRNVAYKLPEHPRNCRLLEGISPQFFKHKENNLTKSFFILGQKDTISFEQNIVVCRAKAFYISENLSTNNVGERKKFKVKASDGFFKITAIWIDGYAQFKEMVLFSNYSTDSTRYPRCQ
jgi:hypothetical protein